MKKSKILIDNRWAGNSGIGRLFSELMKYRPEEVESTFVSSKMGLGNVMSPVMLGNEIRKSKPDIFYSPSFMPPIFPTAPFIFTIHDLMHLFYYSNLHRFYYQKIIARLAKKAKTIITVSHFSKKQMIELMGIDEQLIKVIYNGVEQSFFTNQEKYQTDSPYLLYVGNRRKYKNIPAMLVAFAQANIPKDFMFLLTGNPDPYLIVLVSKLKLTTRVRFLGYIPEEKLPGLYRGAHATLFVSLMEGFGLPLIESMASGTPVLTSNESALPEIADNAALCVNPYKVEEIKNGIETLVSDSALYKDLQSKGLKRASEFSWETTAKKTWETILS